MTRFASDQPAHTATREGDPLTDRSYKIWSAGNYDRVAAGFRHEAEAFVSRLRLGRAVRVLDAACGSGNLTIPAARTGAEVTGLDLVPDLLDLAGAWAAREHLLVRLTEGNVEALPFPDAHFDVVLSMFGVMFAARPERVMQELVRVTHSGSRIALANWTRDSFIGKLLGVHVKYVPPPAGVPSPLAWGDIAVLRERFDAHLWTVATRERTLTFRFPTSPTGVAELFRVSYGPTVRAFEALEEDRRPQLAAELTELWLTHHRSTAAGTEVDSTYLEVVATRR